MTLLPDLFLTQDEFGRCMRVVFRLAYALGEDCAAVPVDGETKKAAIDDLFAEHFPGFEAATDGNSIANQAASRLIREIGAAAQLEVRHG